MKKITMSIFVLVGILAVALPNLAKSGPTIIVICGENKFIDPVNNFVNTVSYNKSLSSRSSAVFDICQAEIPLPTPQASIDSYIGIFELSTNGGITRTSYPLDASHIQSTNTASGEKKWRITVSGLDPNTTYEPSVNSRWTILRGGFENRAFSPEFRLANDFPEYRPSNYGSSSSESGGRRRFAPGQFEQFVAERQAQTIATIKPVVVAIVGTPIVEKVSVKVAVSTPKIREYDPEFGYLDKKQVKDTNRYTLQKNETVKVVKETVASEIGEVKKEMNDTEESSKLTADASASVDKGFFQGCFWWWVVIAIIAFFAGRFTKNKKEEKTK